MKMLYSGVLQGFMVIRTRVIVTCCGMVFETCIIRVITSPWVGLGGFNEFLLSSEKEGGNARPNAMM